MYKASRFVILTVVALQLCSLGAQAMGPIAKTSLWRAFLKKPLSWQRSVSSLSRPISYPKGNNPDNRFWLLTAGALTGSSVFAANKAIAEEKERPFETSLRRFREYVKSEKYEIKKAKK